LALHLTERVNYRIRSLLLPGKLLNVKLTIPSDKGDSSVEHVTSRDGIPIAYERSGEGMPLVLIHGAGADHTRWKPILPELTRHFAVYAVDRRGRGQSGDVEPYSLERESEDVAGVVESIPGPVNLLGHSYGALCSLEASLKTANLRRLILYEPPIHTAAREDYPLDAVNRLNTYLHLGDREKALLIFLQEIAGIPRNEMYMLRSLPSWRSRVAAAHTIPREEASVASYLFEPERFSRMETPTLLLLGGDSPSFYRAAIETLRGSILNSRIVVMPGQRHAAMETAPKLFLSEVIGFLTEKR
jgi:pimeloyl-ACP methyl ester carboxylesterase